MMVYSPLKRKLDILSRIFLSSMVLPLLHPCDFQSFSEVFNLLSKERSLQMKNRHQNMHFGEIQLKALNTLNSYRNLEKNTGMWESVCDTFMELAPHP